MSTLRPAPLSLPSGTGGGPASPALSHAPSFSHSVAASPDAALRRMVWDAALPIVVRVHAPDLPGDVLANAPVDACYVSALQEVCVVRC